MAIVTRTRDICVCAVLLILAGRVDAQEPNTDSAGALLRCDPTTVINSIDGDSHRYVVASYSNSFNDCQVPLSAGTHVLKVCYDVSATTFNAEYSAKCKQDREVKFDASAGRVYRLKLSFRDDWRAWIEDVTDTEAAVPASPTVNKSRRDVPKDQRKSMVLVRASPGDEPAFLTGKVEHLWFKASTLRQALAGPRKMKTQQDGYFTDSISNGDSLALRYSMRPKERTMWDSTFAFVCGDSELPVYEDLPGGKVLYLGDYAFSSKPGGRTFTMTQDLEAARKFLQAYHPELVDKLEPAPVRILRTPETCVIYPNAVLTFLPAQK